MIQRHISTRILEALSDTPVVLLHGARQTGKSTLVQWLTSQEYPARYITMDDIGILAAAHEDPHGFISGLDRPVAIDEVQRVPELFLAIKAQVDQNRQPGQFLLTGSANVMLLPKLSESLTGRMEILTLWPFSQGEIEGKKETFIDTLFTDQIPSLLVDNSDPQMLMHQILSGGYPEVLSRKTNLRKDRWYQAYITTILQREVKDISNIEGLTAMPKLLSMLAARSTSLLNISDLSRTTGIPLTTLKRYLSLMEATFIVHLIPAWFTNLTKRILKTPKIVINDTGLLAHLLNITRNRFTINHHLIGPLVENFVIMELIKQISWSPHPLGIYHYRTQTGQEIDVILENAAGQIVAIEIKAGSTIRGRDFNTIKSLGTILGKRFHRGIVLYNGKEIIPFGHQLYVLPMKALWG